jgi:glucose-6-phosphate 1-epimerase
MTTPDIQKLNEQLAIDNALRFESGPGGLVRAIVDVPSAGGSLFLHGAHVDTYHPRDGEPVLFMSEASWFSPSKPLRGGVPICCPWFGPHPNDPDAPMHGTARLQDWQVTRAWQHDEALTIELSTRIDPFRLVYQVTFGPSLNLSLAVTNTADQSRRCEQALHTYYRVGDVRKIEITGLEGTDYIDKVDGARRKTQRDEPIRFTGEVDRVYLDTTTTARLCDPVLGRVIEVAKTGSRSTVVWNPWIEKAKRMADFGEDEWSTMACIETANATENALDLAPGQTHRIVAAITAEAT